MRVFNWRVSTGGNAIVSQTNIRGLLFYFCESNFLGLQYCSYLLDDHDFVQELSMPIRHPGRVFHFSQQTSSFQMLFFPYKAVNFFDQLRVGQIPLRFGIEFHSL